MRIQNNITAVNAHRNYGINSLSIGKNMEKLSSGYRVNRAADDAAGLAISEKMRAQIRGLNMASRNSQDGISLVQIAESGMQTIQDILQRMRELAVQAASDTNADTVDRPSIQKEVNALITEIDQIVDTTEFNTMKLLDGTFTNKLIQSGANTGQTTPLAIKSVSSGGLVSTSIPPSGSTVTVGQSIASLSVAPVAGGTDAMLSQTSASSALVIIDDGINLISEFRADLGAVQNRLEYKIKNLDNASENMAAAESRIRDADMAKLMTEFTKNNILFQASTAMLAQANALPQGVLQLLG